MTFHVGPLIAHLCKSRHARAIETIEHGESETGFMRLGDTLRIEMNGLDGPTLFGAIGQWVAQGGAAPAAWLAAPH